MIDGGEVQMTHYQLVALYTVPCAVILFILAANCIRLRVRHKVGLGHMGNNVLELAMRAHANAAEHIPIVLIMLVLLAALQASVIFIHAAGICLVVGRALHAIAFSRNPGTTPGRFFGQFLTFTAYLIAVVGLIIALLK